jgi:hypothetical protein
LPVVTAAAPPHGLGVRRLSAALVVVTPAAQLVTRLSVACSWPSPSSWFWARDLDQPGSRVLPRASWQHPEARTSGTCRRGAADDLQTATTAARRNRAHDCTRRGGSASSVQRDDAREGGRPPAATMSLSSPPVATQDTDHPRRDPHPLGETTLRGPPSGSAQMRVGRPANVRASPAPRTIELALRWSHRSSAEMRAAPRVVEVVPSRCGFDDAVPSAGQIRTVDDDEPRLTRAPVSDQHPRQSPLDPRGRPPRAPGRPWC